MFTDRQLFSSYLAQTSASPLLFDVERAEGIYLFDKSETPYIDIISGISVSNVGHRNPKVLQAIRTQLEKYLHVMVYGEFIESPQVKLAHKIASLLTPDLSVTYFVNSGSEAVEGALKLAKRYTGRTEVLAMYNAYHGSTHGALSVMGNEDLKQPFRPLVPGSRFIHLNNLNELDRITPKTACVIVEPVMGEAGAFPASKAFLNALRKKCNQTNTLLIFDEIQTAFGRTGKLFAFQHHQVIPDILLLAKSLGGGMPLGAFISSPEIMKCLSVNPPLGHITTFGGHPLSCAAGLAALEVVIEEKLTETVESKSELFRALLKHPAVKCIRGSGLLLALEFDDQEMVQQIIRKCLAKRLITDWFLFDPGAIRIAPPLIITEAQIREACEIIIQSIDEVYQARK